MPETRPLKIYVAARYSSHPGMRRVRTIFEALGHEVTSRWIDQHGGELSQSFTPEHLNADPDGCGRYAQADVEDMDAADVLFAFTASGGGKGGRHAEFGYMLGRGKRIVLVGPREHVFHTLPQVEWYPDLAALIDAWTAVGSEEAHSA